MNAFIKDNWFKLVLALVVVLIGISAFYYFVILSSQKEARIQQQAQIELDRENQTELEKSIKDSEAEQQKILEDNQKALEDKQKASTASWINQCITDAYSEMKTLQWNEDKLKMISCSSNPQFCSDTIEFWNNAKAESFTKYQNEWVPQCKLGNRVFIHTEPLP